MTQKFGDAVSVSLGKFNMLDVIAKTPLIGGGGEATFWNIGLAAPVSGVTPPYIVGGIATATTAAGKFTLMVYDPRNAQDPDVISDPFAEGTTTSLSTTIPITFFGFTGYHTLRGVYSTAEGFNFDDAPQLLLPQGSTAKLTKQGYPSAPTPCSSSCGPTPIIPARGGASSARSPPRRQSQPDRQHDHPRRRRFDSGTPGRPLRRRVDRLPVEPASSEGARTFGGGLNDERVLEAYYDGAIAPHLRLGPDAQVIWPGTPGKTTALPRPEGTRRVLTRMGVNRMRRESGSSHARAPTALLEKMKGHVSF